MEDQIYYEDCDVCGAHLRSYQEEGGYEGRRYNHKTLLAYQERRLEAPESSFSVKVCQSCLNKEPTLSNLMQKRRLEWYDSSIKC